VSSVTTVIQKTETAVKTTAHLLRLLMMSMMMSMMMSVIVVMSVVGGIAGVTAIAINA